ncbi:sulfate ABC transporter ATP-binding protein [Roseospira marina]|uniref:Sulfate ABC transporter ATP-binding protein n=1 Tax=Roseospira marina TaxID=140057 RepID=A0A5M6I7W3_9PROT|nr:sulfate ABC transporter ATP-binding protein [Roseospira marina]KAA5604253.1 sulfate ABC transporter ATP-binding protein [Roseospira marina]MBB4315600.1 sulfate transport system ATP-binding protein [Roseospira marina]MBB5088596.1 sulfate transport system ATP-binding protein [Roseospira marina]
MDIQVHDIRKAFDGHAAALNGLSLSVTSGELLALLGPSGSGKTTLLRIIAGLETPDSGRLLFNGTDAAHRSVQERNVGFVFQHYALFRHMTVAQNVGFGLAARPRARRPSRPEIRRRSEELLALVQLQGLEHRYPTQLSGGQRQRVALARALAVEPTVLLLDEPFGALDAKVRKDLRRWLRDLHDHTGHTTVFVTHDQEEALELSDRVAIINAGRVEQVGRPSEVYLTPASAFVCGFMGACNGLPVQVRDGAAFLNGATRPVADGLRVADGPTVMYARPHDVALTTDDTGPGLCGIAEAVRVAPGLLRVDMAVPGLDTRLELDIPMSDAHWTAVRPGQPIQVRLTHCHVFPS